MFKAILSLKKVNISCEIKYQKEIKICHIMWIMEMGFSVSNDDILLHNSIEEAKVQVPLFFLGRIQELYQCHVSQTGSSV